jgi:hypothetical protein
MSLNGLHNGEGIFRWLTNTSVQGKNQDFLVG